jgi:hypothetical protein
MMSTPAFFGGLSGGGVTRPRQFRLVAEELVENAAAVGPEHQHHTHQ